jgi:hypothetical protein
VGGIWLSRARIRDDIHSVVWIGAGMALIAAGASQFVFTDGVVLELVEPLSAGLLALIALRLQGWAREG